MLCRVGVAGGIAKWELFQCRWLLAPLRLGGPVPMRTIKFGPSIKICELLISNEA